MRRAGPILCGIAFSGAVFAQAPVRDGRWDVTMQVELPNPPVKTSQCVTKDNQLLDPRKMLPNGPGGHDNSCEVSDYKLAGSKATWKVACTGVDKMYGTGELTFTADTYSGVVKMTTAQGEMTMKYNGKRVGDCTP